MTPTDLAAISGRLAATSPGPWVNHDPAVDDLRTVRAPGHGGTTLAVMSFGSCADAEFIAMAHESDVPRLLEEVTRLRTTLSTIASHRAAVLEAEGAATIRGWAFQFVNEAAAALGEGDGEKEEEQTK